MRGAAADDRQGVSPRAQRGVEAEHRHHRDRRHTRGDPGAHRNQISAAAFGGHAGLRRLGSPGVRTCRSLLGHSCPASGAGRAGRRHPLRLASAVCTVCCLRGGPGAAGHHAGAAGGIEAEHGVRSGVRRRQDQGGVRVLRGALERLPRQRLELLQQHRQAVEFGVNRTGAELASLQKVGRPRDRHVAEQRQGPTGSRRRGAGDTAAGLVADTTHGDTGRRGAIVQHQHEVVGRQNQEGIGKDRLHAVAGVLHIRSRIRDPDVGHGGLRSERKRATRGQGSGARFELHFQPQHRAPATVLRL
ncbi:hypothetical protein CKO21_18535 [Rhodovibrio salinarum]|uniref:Uncharacterized protein n=1 Tax=Rhodovibrio salinarum TaxID=1087 RepID=A0A934QL85_9PROT|nr:hypothetical protein [Rhodovibrio salinarum]